MQYTDVYLNNISYELAPNIVSSRELERRLRPLYQHFGLQEGQLESLTGIYERRFWDPEHSMQEKASLAAKKALAATGVAPQDIGLVIYGGVCRDNLEPATACAVAYNLGISERALIYDVSNACLGALNGVIQVANALQSGQIQAGLVVSCETSQQIIDFTIDKLLRQRHKSMDEFKLSLATLTGGSGAVAMVLSREDLSHDPRFLGWAVRNATEHHKLCRWGPNTGMPASGLHTMETDSIAVLKYGVALGKKTFQALCEAVDWGEDAPEKVICHQVGSAHQKTILQTLGIAQEKDFVTYPYLGNMGTVSLPVTAAKAEEESFFQRGDRVGFLGIGSGLNCMMMGWEW